MRDPLGIRIIRFGEPLLYLLPKPFVVLGGPMRAFQRLCTIWPGAAGTPVLGIPKRNIEGTDHKAKPEQQVQGLARITEATRFATTRLGQYSSISVPGFYLDEKSPAQGFQGDTDDATRVGGGSQLFQRESVHSDFPAASR